MRAITNFPVHVDIFHNILWSKYKGGVFSAIHRLAADHGARASFVQIAETEGDRVALGGVDMNYHQYPFELLFKGAYHDTPLRARVVALVRKAWTTEAELVVLPGYERPEYWAMLAVLVLRRKPRAVFCDSTAFDRPRTALKGLAKRLFFMACDGFFGYGIRSREYLMSYGVPAKRIFFRCQAAAQPLDYTEEKALATRLSLGPTDANRPHFVYVGRLSPEKGLDTLLLAMKAILTVLPNATLSLVGAGPMKEELNGMVKALGLVNEVHLLGSMGVEAIAEQYARATALVLPSTSEPWGLVVNEALSTGCPVVVSDRCGCVPELVVEGETGYSFQAGDVAQLQTRLLQIAKEMAVVEEVAPRCIAHMRSYSPMQAAAQILEGSRAILNLALRA